MNEEIALKLEILTNEFILAWHTIIKDYDDERTVEFDFIKFRRHATNLGCLLYNHGGFPALLDVHEKLPDSMKRVTEMAWSGIGIWRG